MTESVYESDAEDKSVRGCLCLKCWMEQNDVRNKVAVANMI